MGAKFSVKTTFSFLARKSFVLAGEIEEGLIAEGMTVSCENKNFNRTIKSIEAVDFPNGIALVGIVPELSSDRESELLNTLKSGDQLIIF
jgi:selenophosphate synthase